MKTLKIGGTVLAFALIASTAGAQVTGRPWQLSPQGGGIKAIARDPAPTVIVVTPSPVFHQPFFQHQFFPRRALTLIMVPAVVLSNGSVFADFGFGFEPIFRSCGGAVVGPTRVVAGNGLVLSPAAPTYTQPVPAQITPSQQLLPSAQARSVVISSVAQSACFSRDAAGRVFIFR